MSIDHRYAKRAVAGTAVGIAGLALLPAPAGAAISTQTFCAAIPTGQSGFTDIANTAPHTRNIECLKGSGVTSGTTATTYSPTANVSRGQMATFIANMIDRANTLDAPGGTTIPDLPAGNAAPDAFADDEGDTHETNINRLAAADIVQGTTATTFTPAAPVTRAQMATFIAEALEFVRGGQLPEGTDAFTDDEGSVHEANINRLATADIVDGTSATTYNPNGLVSRAQMASFVVQAMADLHADSFITALPAPGATGVITAVNVAGNSYTFTNTATNQSVVVTYDANDTFVVDGAAASEAVFEAALTVGDEISFSDDTTAGDADADQHRLTNVDPATRRSGTVGNVNAVADTFDIVDPVTGVTIGGPFTYTGDVLQVGGSAVAAATFEGALNEGDTVTGTVNGTTETWNVTNQTVTGTVAGETDIGAAGDGAVSFQIGALGDDPKDGDNTHFVTGDETPPGAETFTIGGAPATAIQFETALDNGDTVAYSRNNGIETFALTEVAPAAQTGVATDAENNGLNTVVLANGASDVNVDYTGASAYRVGGVTVTEGEFETALTPGDNVTYTPDNPATPANEEAIELTNANLTGRINGVDTTLNTYDVENSAGNVIDADVAYSGGNNRYFRNGAEVDETTFESLLTKIDADATPDDSVEIVVTSLATEHRLTTDETP